MNTPRSRKTFKRIADPARPHVTGAVAPERVTHTTHFDVIPEWTPGKFTGIPKPCVLRLPPFGEYVIDVYEPSRSLKVAVKVSGYTPGVHRVYTMEFDRSGIDDRTDRHFYDLVRIHEHVAW